jgi:hypothetical protein
MLMFTCGWCGSHYSNWKTRCDSCGGPMPPLPGMELGPPPPPAPRELPKGFERKQMWLGNPLALVGAIFLFVGSFLFLVFLIVLPLVSFFPLLFVILGWFIMRAGRRQSLRVLNAFRLGRAIKGTITQVVVDPTMQVNGQHPWRIHYSFTGADGHPHEGNASTFDSSAMDRQRGQPIWVLAVDDDPDQNTIYPPVK